MKDLNDNQLITAIQENIPMAAQYLSPPMHQTKLRCNNCGDEQLIKYSPILKRDLCRNCAIELEKKHRLEHPEVYLFYNCHVPNELSDRSFENFKGNIKLIEELKQHLAIKPFRSLVLTGVCGSGKTHLAIAMMRWLIQKNINLRLSKLYFLEFPELLKELRSTYNPNCRETENEIMSIYKSFSLLVLDDIGYNEGDGKIANEFSTRILGDLARGWDFERQKFIVTTNLVDNTEIRSVFGERIASRMADARYIGTGMLDYRKIKGTNPKS